MVEPEINVDALAEIVFPVLDVDTTSALGDILYNPIERIELEPSLVIEAVQLIR
jgi:hypothetical protein